MSAAQNPPQDGEVAARSADGGGRPPSLRRPDVYEARKHRRNMSLPEVLLWQQLKLRPNELRFRKQHPVKPYMADFYCAAAKLIIEIDGFAHELGGRPKRDRERDAFFAAKGFKVVRIPASEVLTDAPDVAERLARFAAPLRQSLRDCHLPMNGEGLA